MTPREELALLQRESKPSKHGNVKVYACPKCWHSLHKGMRELQSLKELNKNFKWACCNCNFLIMKNNIESFDSLAEHTRGYGELKPLETAGVITELRHHKIFKLVPKLFISTWVREKTKQRIFFVTDKFDDTFEDPIEFPHNFRKWESDFTYEKKGEKIVEEIKRLGTKKVTRTLTDAATSKRHKQTVSIPWPYFADPEAEFKKKCQLMLAIHGHRVQVRAGGQLWMYNREWKLERKVKNA